MKVPHASSEASATESPNTAACGLQLPEARQVEEATQHTLRTIK